MKRALRVGISVAAASWLASSLATAEELAETQMLYAAGADYVTPARIDQANELIDVITAAEAGQLDDLRARLDTQLRERREILP